jgi:hypothetical protein
MGLVMADPKLAYRIANVMEALAHPELARTDDVEIRPQYPFGPMTEEQLEEYRRQHAKYYEQLGRALELALREIGYEIIAVDEVDD